MTAKNTETSGWPGRPSWSRATEPCGSRPSPATTACGSVRRKYSRCSSRAPT